MCGARRYRPGRGLLVGVGLAMAMAAAALPIHDAAAADGAKKEGGGLFDSVLETLDLKAKVGPAPDFVQATHPDPSTLHFIPTGAPHPKRATPAKTDVGVEATKAALDAAQAAQLAPRPAVPAVPAKTAAPVKRVRKPAKPNESATGN